MAFLALSGLMAFVLRAVILQVSSDAIKDGEIDHYDVAYLSGGRQQVFLTAIGTLSRKGAVVLDPVKRDLTLNSEQSSDLHPVEKDLCASIKFGRDHKVEATYGQFHAAVNSIERRLRKLKLVPTDERAIAAQLIPAMLLLALPVLIGLPRLINGLAQHHPTMFLVVLLLISFATAVWAACCKPLRTSLGGEAVQLLKGEHSALKTNFRACPSALSSDDMTLAYALFGGIIVSATDPFNVAKAAMLPVSTGTGSCSSTGCSSGGGCGSGCGGGCGGGGCGG